MGHTSSHSVSALFHDWRYRALILSTAFAALGYMIFMLWSGWVDVVQAVMRVGIWGIAIILSLSLLNFALRFVRWQLYLKHLEYAVPWRASLNIYLAGFALSTTPGKIGEALRSVMLIPLGVPYRHGIAVFFSERMSDLTAIILVALVGLSSYPKAHSLIAISAVILLGMFAIISSRRVLMWFMHGWNSSNFIAKYFRHVAEIALQVRRCNMPSPLMQATTLSFLAWAAEAWAFHLILDAMDIEVSLMFAAFVYAVAMIAGMISFVPGGIGGAEAVMVALLIWSGVGKPEAVAATLVCRLATLWFAVAIGVTSLSIHKHQALPDIPAPSQ